MISGKKFLKVLWLRNRNWMDVHKTTFVGMLTIQDYSGDSEFLLIMEEPVAFN